MKRDQVKILFIEILLVIILFFALFAQNIFQRNVLAVIMLIYSGIVFFNLKKKHIDSIFKKQVKILMLVFASIYVCLFYLSGLYFGYARSAVNFSFWSIRTYIIPLSIIIICSEFIRKKFLAQNLYVEIKAKKINLSLIFSYIFSVLIDLLIYTKVYDFSNLDNVLTAIGFVLFASLSCNLFYNYVSRRYSSTGIVIYRLITVLFVYFIPVTVNMYIFFRSFLRMLYPFIMYVIVDKLFSQNDFVVANSQKKRELVTTSIVVVVIALIVMLVSCQFRYGILVIGSDSMTGTINKGDAIIFEKYDNQIIDEGQVIMFEYNGMRVVHRVVEAKEVNGIPRYYTKGDANAMMDKSYRTKKDIYGVVNLKIKYIGYPTLWLRSLFE